MLKKGREIEKQQIDKQHKNKPGKQDLKISIQTFPEGENHASYSSQI